MSQIFISILKFIDIFSAENHVSKIYLNIKNLSIFLVQNHKDLSTVHDIIFFQRSDKFSCQI